VTAVVDQSPNYKFQKLEIYQLALCYLDLAYSLAEKLPRSEDYNLRSQLIRAATSVVLNIAEGSTGQSNPEQSRFPGMARRSLVETVTCQEIIERRKYAVESDPVELSECGHKAVRKNTGNEEDA